MSAKCSICSSTFKPRAYDHTVCSDACRKIRNQNYKKKLQQQGYFKKYQWKNRETIYARNNEKNRLLQKNKSIPKPKARKCAECNGVFTPVYRNKRFCCKRCNIVYMAKHPEEKTHYVKTKKSIADLM